MKIFEIIILFSLTVIVKGAAWVAAAQPILLGLGAAFAAIDLDIQNVHPYMKIPGWDKLVDKGRKGMPGLMSRLKDSFVQNEDVNTKEANEKQAKWLGKLDKHLEKGKKEKAIKDAEEEAKRKKFMEETGIHNVSMLQNDSEAYVFDASFDTESVGGYYDEF